MNSSNNEPMLTVRNLSAIFPNGNGGLQALDNLSFSVLPQQFLCVLGPSGSGKSTLLRIISGLLPPTQGEVFYGDEHLTAPRHGVGFVFRRPISCPGEQC
jgi:NitT/TauT family transport system ATP-binding protein